ncbi:MAG: endolytic transglycosylase MltG [Bacilli bacterium]|nr:endolytic transglycosylase MltG [Bacilli bacterium]
MKKYLIIGLSALAALIIAGIIFVIIGTGAVNKKDKTQVLFTINAGDSRTTIINNLNKAGLIKNKLAGTIYININRGKNLQAATYELNRTMSLKEILNKFDKGEKYDNRVAVTLKFVPGKRITSYAETIASFVNEYQDPAVEVTKDDIIKEINDKEYVKTLIDKYWFLTDEVLDGEIYYALEGYLQPETYQFYTTSTVKEIVERMLDQTDKKLTPLKESIKKSGYTVHEILSAAAIIEKEANSDEDRKKVAQVIYTRIAKKMNLGMDVTAYYAAKVEQTKDNPYMYSWNFLPSKYNTRNKNNLGLPIGPICNPSLSSINAALNPSDTNYVYFYADINTGKVYFAEDYAGFMKIQKDLGV